jgi:hypothetical protein
MFNEELMHNQEGAKRSRILVVANETVADDVLISVIRHRAGWSRAQVLVVAPALTGRLAYWSSDSTLARRNARGRLLRCLEALEAEGIDAEGQIGDADPLLAIDDALRLFRADEIIVATHPEGRSNWLERDVVARARSRLPQRIVHIVVDASGDTEVRAA